MSLVHVRLIKTGSDERTQTYCVESSDFDKERQWLALGLLTLDRSDRNYAFAPGAALTGKKFMPPEVYQTAPAQRQQYMQSQFPGFGWGAWSMAIHHLASTLLSRDEFPAQHPAALFKS